MARLRFYNGKVLKNYKIVNEEVWVEDGIITDKPGRFDREVNLNGNLLMPSFKNAHAHSGMVFLRSYADGLSLKEWLETKVWPSEAHLDDESIYYFTKLAILESLRGGITASFDMYVHNDAYMQACDETGYKGIIASGLNDFDKDIYNIEREFLKFKGKFILGIHGEYTTCKERLDYCLSLAEKYKAPCYTHLNETQFEVDGSIKRNGKPAGEYLYDEGFFKYGGGGFHCCHMTEKEIEIFASNNLYAVSCPASNLKLASGVAPIEKMRHAGIKIALGTDGAASNNALNMFREMYLVSVLQKNLTGDASACPPSEVLKMACMNGAHVMGLNDCDDIDIGKKADLIVINLNLPNMQPENDIVADLVFSANNENILMTVVDGRILYENGNYYLNDDPEEIYRKSRSIVRNILE